MLRRSLQGTLSIALLGFVLIACGDTPVSPAEVDLSGTWMGEGVWSSDSDTDTITLALTLDETSDGSLSGDGRYSNEETDSYSLTVVSGTRSGRSVNLELLIDTLDARPTYSGSIEVEDDSIRIDGSFSSSFNSVPITLTKCSCPVTVGG